MEKIYIRVDGNETIASGHVMRCLSVAQALRELDREVVFVVADARPLALIADRGFKVDVLGTVWNDFNQEKEILCRYMIQNRVRVLLLDSYYVTKEYLDAIHAYATLIYMDDLKKFDYTVDALVHYSPFVDMQEYSRLYSGKRLPDLLCGETYIPLRREFRDTPYQLRKEVSRVFITTGGTDQLNVAGNLLHRLLMDDELRQLEYHVVIGCFHSKKETLYQLAREHKGICIHENVENMAEYMRACDVAISAGGTTLYELCACGIPTVCLEVADNQAGAEIWEQRDYMEYAGNAYLDMQACVTRCQQALHRYRSDFEMRKRRSQRMQQLVDGKGAERIAQYIVRAAEQKEKM